MFGSWIQPYRGRSFGGGVHLAGVFIWGVISSSQNLKNGITALYHGYTFSSDAATKLYTHTSVIHVTKDY